MGEAISFSLETHGTMKHSQLGNDIVAGSGDFQDGEDVRDGSIDKFVQRKDTAANTEETLPGSAQESPLLQNHHIWHKLPKASRPLSLFQLNSTTPSLPASLLLICPLPPAPHGFIFSGFPFPSG